MKTTIMYWDRGEGKTTAIIDMLRDGIDTVIVVPSNKQVEFIKKKIYDTAKEGEAFPHPDIGQIHVISWNSPGLLGHSPQRIIIDNADELSQEIFSQRILPSLTHTKDVVLVVTTTDVDTLKLFLGCKGGIVLEQREAEALKIFLNSPLKWLFDKPVLHFAMDKINKKLENIKIEHWQK